MNFWETVNSAMQSLKGNKIRSLLTMLGIIIGIASVIIISMVGKGSQNSITGELLEMSDKSIILKVQSDDEILKKKDYINENDLEKISEFEGISGVSPSLSDRGRMVINGKPKFSIIQSTDEDFLKIVNTDLLFGRLFNEEEITLGKKVVLIDDIYAMRKFGKIDVAGEDIEMEFGKKGNKFTAMVVGVFEHPMKSLMQTMGREMYQPYIPYITFQKYVKDTQITVITIVVNDLNEKDNITNKVIDYLESAHNKTDIYEVSVKSSPVDSFNSILNTLSILLTSIAAISLLVGGIGVMNIMLVSVTERTREIGIRKALGAKKKDILFQFLIEAVALTLIGGFVGISIGYILSIIIANVMGIKAVVDYFMLIIAVSVSGGIGIIFGTFPAKKASDLHPIDALRHE